MELLIHLRNLGRFHTSDSLVDDVSEVRWSVKLAVADGLAVLSYNGLDAVDPRIEDITIQGEAVGSTLCIRWNCGSVAIQIDHLITVVELKDVANALDGLHVLISTRVRVMKRARITWVSI